MLEVFAKSLKSNGILTQGDSVLLAVSGGPDSMAMLHCFSSIRDQWRLQLEVAHVHHGIRGEEADEDARFVERSCKELKLPCHLYHFDVPRFAQQKRLSLEEACREIRYHFLLRCAKERHLKWVAVAHTADDQVETVLMNFLRGAGPRGLSGIQSQRNEIIRPLLPFKREDILSFLEEEKVSYRTDASNEDRTFYRNWIRHEVLPKLQSNLTFHIKESLLRSAEIFRDEEEWIDSVVSPLFEERYERLIPHVYHLKLRTEEKLPVALERRLIRKFLETVLKNLDGISFSLLETIRALLHKETGKRFCFLSHIVEKTPDGLALSQEIQLWHEDVELVIPGKTIVSPLFMSIHADIQETFPKCRDHPYEAFLDYEKIRKPLTIRTRRPGDHFSPVGFLRTKKLQDYFVDRKVPRLMRDRIPLIVVKDQIVCIGGYDTREDYKVTEKTTSVLRLQFSEC